LCAPFGIFVHWTIESFRILLRDGDIAIVGVSPRQGTSCFDLLNDFAGTVGPGNSYAVQHHPETDY
jgi:hypothetical protein